MALERLFPSMFQRRLLLLACLLCAPIVPLVAQVSRLTVLKHDELKAQAEARLVRRQWTATNRGAILDRKGRLLAIDKPSYAVLVEYEVLTGNWANRQATSAAQRSAGDGWYAMTAAQRESLVGEFRQVFRLHLENSWDELALRAGVAREVLDANRDRVLQEIDARHQAVQARRRQKEIDDARARGEPLTPELQREIEKRAAEPIAEQRSSHVILASVPDDVGFSCQLLASEEAELIPPPPQGEDLTIRPEPITVPAFPGLAVRDSGDREYPYERIEVELSRSFLPGPVRSEEPVVITVDGVACHILGRLRDRIFGDAREGTGPAARIIPGDASLRAAYLNANPDERARVLTADGEDRGEYREGDRVGDSGVEGTQEHLLRGLRGVQTFHLDTGEREFLPAVPGRDVQLTLDVMLQARIQAVMTPEFGLAAIQQWHARKPEDLAINPIGTPLNGAAVVLDVDTGDIIAMVSTPTFTRRQLREDPASVFGDSPAVKVSTPWLNRCIARPYQPGSVVKAVLLSGAVTEGVYDPASRIDCTGRMFQDVHDAYRCWIYKQFQTTHNAQLGHGLTGSDAVMASCNIFFYTLGRRLGPEGVVDVYRKFGVGEPLGLGAGPEYAGVLGSGPGSAITASDAIFMGIGQGPIAWTPVHAANSYAILAREGVKVQPRLIAGRARPAPTDLRQDTRGIHAALDGLLRVVSKEQGATGYALSIDGKREPIFNAEGVTIWGKTGTAAASPITGDPDGEGPRGPEVLESGDHSWFVILAGRDRPRYAIAVVIDFGGSGGKVSGPIANQIVHALIAEGYL